MNGRGTAQALTDMQLARADVVLHAALEQSPPDRVGLVRKLCAGDEAVCSEVLGLLEWVGQDDVGDRSQAAAVPLDESLLAEAGGPEQFVETGDAQLRPGDHLGDYRILEQLGEGGFAVVYLAQQESPVRRRVALKIVKPGMDSREVINRFAAERQVLALMDHANVARVFEAGSTERGRPYFVMEYVPGVCITEHCDRQRLGITARLSLFMQVCEAVQHAHQKGIIHRDLKPSNVLVTIKDGHAVPKVIDFGVAKALDQRLTDKTIFTGRGQIIGTPEYMSPEQAEMTAQDIDTRSDIYSLGVLLYELLTGTLPFDRKTFRRAAIGEIQRIIREQEPPKPSTRMSRLEEGATSRAERRRLDQRCLLRELRGDLDWIVMKALEKDRSRRYETAHGLAMDIRRHLAHEPVIAGPPSTAYKLKKFARRHRASVLAGAIASVSLFAAAALSTAFGLGEADARRVAEDAQQSAEVLLAEVSALKQKLEQESAEAMGLYKQVFAEASDAIMTFDYETGQFTEANQATLDLLGYSKEEFLDLKVTDISAEAEKTKEAVRKIAAGDLSRITRWMQKKDGTRFLVEIYSGKFTWQGRVTLIGIVRPIKPAPEGIEP